MVSTAAMEKAGKEAGLQVWRIENLEMVPVPKHLFGQFFTGDSYIILNTRSVKGKSFSWDLHFWLGNESSQDERGAAAILTAQLDDYLGGYPVQYREIQGMESTEFKGYFKKGITYKQGGVNSGFKHVNTNVSDVKRLLHVKGRRTVRATEVKMEWKSFNKGDIFVVEVGNDIFQWNGSESNRYERLKACQLVHSLRDDEKGGKGKIHVINEGEKIPKIMLEVLQGTPDDVGPEVVDEETVAHGRAHLYHVSSDTGTLVVKKIADAPFKQEMLDTGDCYILDNGANGALFVWKGKKASTDERSGAMKNALKFIKDHGYPESTKIQVMAEGAESALFTQFFKDWMIKNQQVGLGKVYRHEKIAKIEKKKFDVTTLHSTPKLAAQERMVDDGSGKVEVWRVEGNKLVPVKEENQGHFYAGDSYIILYTYKPRSREEYIVYSWQGLDSTKDEIAGSAFHSRLKHEEYNGRTVQCRVVQGKEPQHLLSIFKHPILISYGGYDKAAGKTSGTSATALYQVRSTAAGGTKVIEVQLSSSMLNSNDTFLLKNPKQSFIWIGKGSNEIEVDAALYGAKLLKCEKDIKRIEEGKENEEFWKLLGGKKEYASSLKMQESLETNPPRLFVISNARGRIHVEEIPGEFVQSDLEPDDVMMLDALDEVFIWIGDGANEEEKKEAPRLVDEYIAQDPRGRDTSCPVITVRMGSEPVTFTGYFPSWDNHFYNKRRSIVDLYQNLRM